MWFVCNLNIYINKKMSKNSFFLAITLLLAWNVLLIWWVTANYECSGNICYDQENMLYRIISSEDREHAVVIQDRNLWASGTGQNWYTYQWWNNMSFWNDNFETTETLAVWNNKFNNTWYNLGSKFIVGTTGDYWSYWLHHDWLRWWIGDENDDVYDVDVFRQWPCPKWFHVPTLSDWEELRQYLTDDQSDFSFLRFPTSNTYRDFASWNSQYTNDFRIWTSTPVVGSEKAVAVVWWNSGQIARSMWLQVRCFQNKMDAMVWVQQKWSDIVFYDTVEPTITSGSQSSYLTLLNYSGRYTTFDQEIKLQDSIRSWNDISFLFLRACTGTNSDWSLDTWKLSVNFWLIEGLNVQCNMGLFNLPWNSRVLTVNVVGTVGDDGTSCSNLLDDDRVIITIEDDFVKDFSMNWSSGISIASNYIYAPTDDGSDDSDDTLWNYIYTPENIMSANDDDLILWWTNEILSAEPIQTGGLRCVLLTWHTLVEELSLGVECSIGLTQEMSEIQMWQIHFCWTLGCAESNNQYRRNQSEEYQTIIAPFKYKTNIRMEITWDINQLSSGDTLIVWIFLNDQPSNSCYSRNDWTDATYINIMFKKIISPYKAGYLSGDNWWVRYSQYNLWTTLQSWGTEKWWKFYVSNLQTVKTWGMSWGVLGKINFVIDANQEIPDMYYYIDWKSQVGDYEKEINIKRSTSDEEENPDVYKGRFPTY